MIAKLPLVRRVILLAGIFSAASALATPQAATPNFSPAAGAYASAQSVTITSATSGASIAYTTDGSIPTVSGGTVTHGALYSGPITVSTTTLSAIAFESGYADSAVAISGYSLQPVIIPAATIQVAAPSFNPAPATFVTAASVDITTSTSGATIRYTVDGSTPTETHGTIYTSSVYISSATTLNAIAYETGFTDSSVTSGTYTFNLFPMPGLNILCSFLGSTEGKSPQASLVQGSDGNFYGTTKNGGNSNLGTAFKITSAGSLTILASFNGTNGNLPEAALIQGSDGNFYGTTNTGGINAEGNVFKMTPAGVVTNLVSFTGANGASLLSPVVQGTDGNFYGTTSGGTSLGTAFKVTSTGTLTSLVSFTSGANGNTPFAGLVQGSDGNFYGTTSAGGGSNKGTVFKMTPAGVLTTLVSFTGTNGDTPYAGLVQGSDGNFYGTTSAGGSSSKGTVFKMTSAGVLTTLVSFTGTNGDTPWAGLVQGSDGNFYGTTSSGGGIFNGTVFKMTPAGALTTLVSFNGVDGGDLLGGVIQGTDGNLYGTASFGGNLDGAGTIFQVVLPSSIAAPIFSPAVGTYTSTQTVTISTTTNPTATPTTTTTPSIAYTADGSTPTEVGGVVTHGTLYSGPISIGSTTTIKAIAFESGMDSSMTSGTYTISPAAGGGGGGAPSYGFLGFLAFAAILRWKLRKIQAPI